MLTFKSSAVTTTPLLFALYLLGMLCLPIASFEMYRDLPDSTISVLGNALAFENPWNRGAMLGGYAIVAACIVGAIQLSRRSVTSSNEKPRSSLFRSMSAWDAVLATWISAPTVTGFFNPSPIAEDLWQSLYIAIAWGGPYLAGRVLVSSTDDLRRSLWVVFAAGAVSLVPALVEFASGRFVYQALYGYNPYQSIGESRWFGYRPILWFEDPNQVAMWWMTIAVTAMGLIPAWFVASKTVGLKWVAMGLPFLFQGVGSAILTIIGALARHVRRISSWKYWIAGTLVLGGILFLARGPVLQASRELARQSGIEEVVKSILRESSLGSFGWRLAREEQDSNLWKEHPITGSGSVMFWSDAGQSQRPWGMFSLVTSAYGCIGSGILLWMLFGPLVTSLFIRRRGDHNEAIDNEAIDTVQKSVPVLIALHGLDGMINSAFFLPILWLYGAWVTNQSPPAVGAARE
ncbi:MAG: hypothetical protein ACK5N9_10840 [Pirellula sp.]